MSVEFIDVVVVAVVVDIGVATVIDIVFVHVAFLAGKVVSVVYVQVLIVRVAMVGILKVTASIVVVVCFVPIKDSIAKILCAVSIVEVVVVVVVVAAEVVDVVKVLVVGVSADVVWRKPLVERFSSHHSEIRSQPKRSPSLFLSKLLKIKISKDFAQKVLHK